MESLLQLPLPVLIFSMGGSLISLIAGVWTGIVFLRGILEGIYQKWKEDKLRGIK